MVKPGIYLHFKGSYYNVICVATDTETKSEYVIYKSFDGKTWARSVDVFTETVCVDGVDIERFRYVGEN